MQWGLLGWFALGVGELHSNGVKLKRFLPFHQMMRCAFYIGRVVWFVAQSDLYWIDGLARQIQGTQYTQHHSTNSHHLEMHSSGPGTI